MKPAPFWTDNTGIEARKAMSDNRPEVSLVLATHNRRDVVMHTLARIARCGLDRDAFEVIVVDNASTDGTPGAIAPLADGVVRLRANAGSCAKAVGVDRAKGRYIVFLDDDSFPRIGSIPRMIEHFEQHDGLGAAGFLVHLPDGRQESSALPGVFVGCGVGFRADALQSVGGLDRSFFMQAEEYDLTFRLVGAGWRVRMFDDLHVEHLKTACARRSRRTTYYDVRNNLRVAARYLPAPAYRLYRADWLRRYAWLAERDGHQRAHHRGARAGLGRAAIERRAYRGRRLTPAAFERFFRWEYVCRRMADLADSGVRRIALADLGKNVLAYQRAAQENSIDVLAIGDDRFAGPARRYRGIPLVTVESALKLDVEAVVVANTSSVHGASTLERITRRTSVPVHHWFGRTSREEASARLVPGRLPGVEQTESLYAFAH